MRDDLTQSVFCELNTKWAYAGQDNPHSYPYPKYKFVYFKMQIPKYKFLYFELWQSKIQIQNIKFIFWIESIMDIFINFPGRNHGGERRNRLT